MTGNNFDMAGLGCLREMSVTEHLRNSIYKHLFCEQDTDNCQFISWDVNGSDHSGSKEN